MITMLLVLSLGFIGGCIGEFGFEQHCIFGSIIGAVMGLIIRFGGGEGASGIGEAFSDFGDFGGGD